MTETVNGSAAITAKRRDMLGRVINVLEPAVNGSADLTTYTYDALDKLATVSETAQSRTFGYDYSGFLRSESTPERGSVSYTLYDALGDLKTKTDGGVIYTYVYDTAGRLQTLSTNEGGSRTYLSNTYDQNPSSTNLSYGRLTQQVGTNYALTPSMTVTDSFTYGNAAGRLSQRQTSFSSGVLAGPLNQSWYYNSLGLIAQHNHPRPASSANFVEYTAYTTGLPTTEYGAGINLVTNVSYQPAGALGGYETGTGTGHDVVTTIAQNAATLMPRPASISTSGASSNFVSGTYGYDGVGNITSIGSDSFTYDSRSRLTEASLATLGNPQWYCYDLYGNLFTKVFAASQPNCGTTVWSNNRIPGAGYDGRGNVTSDGADSYTYDGLDRMLQHTTSGFKYLYDGSNERQVRIPTSGSWNYTLRDESERLTTEFSGTVWSRDNIFLGNLLIGSYANSAVSGNGPVWSFYASDHLGTPRIVTDISGTTVDSRKSWPYGEDATTPGTFQRVRFASMERDTEGSRYFDHARHHETGRGRFLSADPKGGQDGGRPNPQAWNRYVYSLNSPLLFLDPTGAQANAFAFGIASHDPRAVAAATATIVPILKETTLKTALLVGVAGAAIALLPVDLPLAAGSVTINIITGAQSTPSDPLKGALLSALVSAVPLPGSRAVQAGLRVVGGSLAAQLGVDHKLSAARTGAAAIVAVATASEVATVAGGSEAATTAIESVNDVIGAAADIGLQHDEKPPAPTESQPCNGTPGPNCPNLPQ